MHTFSSSNVSKFPRVTLARDHGQAFLCVERYKGASTRLPRLDHVEPKTDNSGYLYPLDWACEMDWWDDARPWRAYLPTTTPIGWQPAGCAWVMPIDANRSPTEPLPGGPWTKFRAPRDMVSSYNKLKIALESTIPILSSHIPAIPLVADLLPLQPVSRLSDLLLDKDELLRAYWDWRRPALDWLGYIRWLTAIIGPAWQDDPMLSPGSNLRTFMDSFAIPPFARGATFDVVQYQDWSDLRRDAFHLINRCGINVSYTWDSKCNERFDLRNFRPTAWKYTYRPSLPQMEHVLIDKWGDEKGWVSHSNAERKEWNASLRYADAQDVEEHINVRVYVAEARANPDPDDSEDDELELPERPKDYDLDDPPPKSPSPPLQHASPIASDVLDATSRPDSDAEQSAFHLAPHVSSESCHAPAPQLPPKSPPLPPRNNSPIAPDMLDETSPPDSDAELLAFHSPLLTESAPAMEFQEPPASETALDALSADDEEEWELINEVGEQPVIHEDTDAFKTAPAMLMTSELEVSGAHVAVGTPEYSQMTENPFHQDEPGSDGVQESAARPFWAWLVKHSGGDSRLTTEVDLPHSSPYTIEVEFLSAANVHIDELGEMVLLSHLETSLVENTPSMSGPDLLRTALERGVPVRISWSASYGQSVQNIARRGARPHPLPDWYWGVASSLGFYGDSDADILTQWRHRMSILFRRPESVRLLQYGGIVWRIARQFMPQEILFNVLRLPSAMYLMHGEWYAGGGGHCEITANSQDDRLLRAVIGTIHDGSTYFPPPEVWAASAVFNGFWNALSEDRFQAIWKHVRNGTAKPRTRGKWVSDMRGWNKGVREALVARQAGLYLDLGELRQEHQDWIALSPLATPGLGVICHGDGAREGAIGWPLVVRLRGKPSHAGSLARLVSFREGTSLKIASVDDANESSETRPVPNPRSLTLTLSARRCAQPNRLKDTGARKEDVEELRPLLLLSSVLLIHYQIVLVCGSARIPTAETVPYSWPIRVISGPDEEQNNGAASFASQAHLQFFRPPCVYASGVPLAHMCREIFAVPDRVI
ncbi:hypothetical protein BV25DRAFT_1842997 [Artomyces pyxidatus]|uniref:Uncharacterized protein n=1 Tax=Artomyces pyxidatus TaxID=48021 RepID=A0ACB8SFZ7_9AGAM|nr:hypothetical protein BV25DRAFT_1842997 [Artomyces pyxidatus]